LPLILNTGFLTTLFIGEKTFWKAFGIMLSGIYVVEPTLIVLI